jgi:uncharacterized protein with von Willebrand factor type A (vWA) domain
MLNRFSFNKRNTYSRWDGTQRIEGLDADDILNALADDYLTNNDLRSAIQRLQMQGFEGRNGQQAMGLRDLIEKLRQQQQNRLQRYDMSGIMDDIRQQLETIKQHEREGIQNRLDNADPARSTTDQQKGNALAEGLSESSQPDAGNQRDIPEGIDPAALRRALEQIAQRKKEFLNNLPPDPAGQIKSLSEYDFMDDRAREEFEQLKQMLQQQVMNQYFQGMQQSISQMSPQDLARMREMLHELNQMLREREEGREPDFDGFMQRYGDFFGPNINTLDDLIEDMQRRMAQMQAIMDSMTPEQRAQLQSMMDELLGDDRVRVEMAELAEHIGQQGPNDYRTRYRLSGDEPVSLTEAMQLMGELQGLDELERQMNMARRRGNLDAIDSEKTLQLLGEEDATSLEELKSLMRQLEEAGYIVRNGDRWQLASAGIRKIGQKALQDMFADLGRDAFGQHRIDEKGFGGERTDESKPYVFGDPFLLDMHATLRRSLNRNGPGLPLTLKSEDFEVYRTELLTQSSTVLMIDMSHSMVLTHANQAAKKVAVALESLIRGQFPRDNLYVVGFSRIAREFKRDELIEIGEWDHSQGTNMVHGLMLARHLLAKHKSANKQIIMITDGGPTMMWDKENKDWIFTYPYTYPAELQTLLEVQRCTRDNITINTFMLVRDHSLVDFVRNVSEINKGRAFLTEPEDLGKYVLIDYLSSKQTFRRLT